MVIRLQHQKSCICINGTQRTNPAYQQSLDEALTVSKCLVDTNMIKKLNYWVSRCALFDRQKIEVSLECFRVGNWEDNMSHEIGPPRIGYSVHLQSQLLVTEARSFFFFFIAELHVLKL